MRISHETIYRSLYVQARGELRRQLTAQLRTGRSTRRARGRVETRGRIPDRVPIAERPPEVDDRRVPGHWEGDLLMGAAGTLADRHAGRAPDALRPARSARRRARQRQSRGAQAAHQDLPAHLVRSLTWDRGKELTAHRRFTVDTDVRSTSAIRTRRGSAAPTRTPTDCCASTSRKTPTSPHDQADLDQVAAELNGRPRKTLAWATPAERMEALLR